jgi:hypothetical protein
MVMSFSSNPEPSAPEEDEMGERTNPDHTFENRVRAAGHRCHALWEMRGPKDTNVAWIVAYAIDGKGPVLVQTYEDGDGWDAFSPCRSNEVGATVTDALTRLGVTVQESA